jgi:DNA phosphorothioation-associated putative methyltransferase
MVVSLPPSLDIPRLCQTMAVGKTLPDAFYLHTSALDQLPTPLRQLEQRARQVVPGVSATLVKFRFRRPQIAYLHYPDFDTDPHPALHSSTLVDLAHLTATTRSYQERPNPPILHRKETFVAPDYPGYANFVHLTQQEIHQGLLDQPRTIGLRRGWQQRLQSLGLEIHHHALACPLAAPRRPDPPAPIQRHRAAIARVTASKPLRLALEAGLIPAGSTYFDYGCGHGIDIEYLQRLGYSSQGWDPHFRPHSPRQPADVVNLAYVINVIEDTGERRQALIEAWQLAEKLLIVAAQVLVEHPTAGAIPYGDGIITRRQTFQRYYDQEELKAYIDQVLRVDAIPIALGIYLVFRDQAQAENFRASRWRRRATTPGPRLRVSRFETHRQQLQPLMEFYAERGRLPVEEEVSAATLAPLQATFGSLRRAFAVVLKATDAAAWDAIADQHRHDLLVYLALSQFGQRPPFKALSAPLQRDIKGLFGSYPAACNAADLLLISLGQPQLLGARCGQSRLGQQRPRSLWVHLSALDQLDPLLRLYEGCAARTIGRPQEATVVKLHRHKPQVTYLEFADFDQDPHPALVSTMAIDLQDLRVRYRDYDGDNPPLLHQKHQLVAPDYPGYARFLKLSQQEERWGLLENLPNPCDRRQWQQRLIDHGAALKGHRLVRQKASPVTEIRQAEVTQLRAAGAISREYRLDYDLNTRHTTVKEGYFW